MNCLASGSFFGFRLARWAPLPLLVAAGIAVADAPDLTAAELVTRGDALMQRSREIHDAGLYPQAEAAYRGALSIEPDNAGALLGLAWVHNSEHEFEAGRRYAERALRADPDRVDAHLLLSDIAVERGDYDGAFAQLQIALDRRPDLAAYSRAGHLLWLTGEPERAHDLMERAIRAGGPFAENVSWCRTEYARMLFHAGALDAAAEQIARALATTPASPRALAVAARIQVAQGDPAGGLELYRRSIESAPTHEALVGLGDLYSSLGRDDEAEARYREVVEFHRAADRGASHHRDHGNPELASFYADHDRRLDEALALAREAFRESKGVYAADALAWSYYKNGQLEPARETIALALRWNTPDARLLLHAGIIHDASGDRVAALRFLERALALNPRFDPRDAPAAGRLVARLADLRDSAAGE